jgi:hypothetical protein
MYVSTNALVFASSKGTTACGRKYGVEAAVVAVAFWTLVGSAKVDATGE